jgi:transposase-like protein
MYTKNKQAEEKVILHYSYGFKKQVIEEIENGLISMNQAAKKYKVYRSTIQRWFQKMGNFEKRLRAMGGKSPRQEISALRRKIKELEQEKEILDFAIDMLQEESGVDIRKKFLPESLQNTLKRKGKE